MFHHLCIGITFSNVKALNPKNTYSQTTFYKRITSDLIKSILWLFLSQLYNMAEMFENMIRLHPYVTFQSSAAL